MYECIEIMDSTAKSKCNESLFELTHEDLQAELLKSRSACKQYQQIIDDRNQEVHILKRRIVSLEFENQQYQQEIDHISSTELIKYKTLQARIQELETIRSSRNSCSDENGEVERLLSECEIHRKTIAELEANLKENFTLRSVNKEEFDDLAEENNALKSKYEFISGRYANVLQELQEANAQVKTLNDEVEDIRNTYASNLGDTKAKLIEQEEQIAFLRADLLNAHSAQQNKDDDQHAARGNSMFSEVYDNWNILKRSNETLVLAHQEARKERNKLRIEVASLRRENMSMCERWKIEGIEARQKDADIINTYKYANDKLLALVKTYEEELAKERNTIYSTNDVSVYMNMIKYKNEQIEKLYKEFRQANGHSIMHHLEVRDVNNKARKYMIEATQYKKELELLQKDLDHLKESQLNTGSVNTDKAENSDTVLRHVATQTDRVRVRTLQQSTTDNEKQCDPEKSSSNAINVFEPSIDEGVRSLELREGEDGGKENDFPCKAEGKKVQFADSVPEMSGVNQQKRRPRPTGGKPIDCSKLIVIKRREPKKL